ncbi:uncharacterized protein LOC110810472 isoform X2 [Carica papaya]|uniref:uncharacterized protein LOC110810472 isoform X2 n=1 Tax=Carica papaya TaxID=3649 RepID=UPI000B8CC30A|nr:uncharacterized protein LOC110810472 isoform X2 [Carica papaya]
MKLGEKNLQFYFLLVLPYALLFPAGLETNALSYDYTASIQCLENPQKAQYGGGIITNPELNQGLKGWSTFGDAKIQHRVAGSNSFIVAHTRSQPHDSVSQTLYLQSNKLYTFSAWIRVSEGKTPVKAIFKTKSGYKYAGAVVAESNCWSMLKGGLTVDASGPAELYFETDNTSVEIWIDSISLQPFTQQEWKSHQDQSIKKIRKKNVRIQAVDKLGNPLPNTTVSISPKKIGFPFGCAINRNILNNNAYQSWFSSRFTVTTFENEMKWASTEPSQGHEDYSTADAMVQFAKKNGIAIRGHNVFWDDPKYQSGWVSSLSPNDLNAAATKRINSVMNRYKGQVIGWDVVNENLHFSFFESKLGANASAVFYGEAHKTDPSTTLFMNEYNTVEDSRDGQATPAKYLEKLRSIQSLPGNGNMGIGLESHFSSSPPNIPYMRSAIDTLAATGLPVWLTEVDVQSGGNQAQSLEQILREAHSHPKVRGIVIWSAWSPNGCYRMCLTDNNFHNLPTGDVVDKLLREWGGGATVKGKTDQNGFFQSSLFHGDYEIKVQVNHPSKLPSSSSHHTFKLNSTDDESKQTRLLLIKV